MRRTVLVLAAGLLCGCAAAEPQHVESAHAAAPVASLPAVNLPAELDRVLRDYEKAWRAGDAAALAQLFTEDGFSLSNGTPAVQGRPAIREGYGQAGTQRRELQRAKPVANPSSERPNGARGAGRRWAALGS